MRGNALATIVCSSLILSAACGGDDAAAPTDSSDESQTTDHASEADASMAHGLDGGRPQLDASAPSKSDASLNEGTPHADAATTAPKPDSGTTGPTSTRAKPKCVKKDTQVMVVGDSYINWISHTFPQDMIAASGQTWRMEAIGAYSMGSGGIGLIGDQYKNSIAKDPDCHTILMDGGGNDILVADPSLDPGRDCLTDKSATLPQCQKIIDKALAAADDLLKKASAAGIRDVVYFFYPHVPTGTLLGGPSPNTVLDFAFPQVQKFCNGVEAETQGKTRCTFIDMRPVFQGHDDWFIPGDIHENSMGSSAMAKKIWQVMTDGCIAQKSGAGCCEE